MRTREACLKEKTMSDKLAERRVWTAPVTLTLLFLLALAIREFSIARTSFWVDEIIAVTHTLVPFLEIPLHLIRFDMHPPLYFLQLDIWSWLGGSDGWLRLNSVLWSSAAVALLYWAVRRHGDERHAFWSALVLAFLPGAIFYAHEVRMYSMLLVPMILGWHWTCSYFEAAAPSRREARRLLLAVGAMELALIYSHAIGFFMVFFLAVYGFALALGPVDKTRFRSWFILQAIAGIAALPMVASALMRGSASSAPDSGAEIARHLSFLVFGSTGDPSAPLQALALGILALAALAALHRPRLRLETACLLLLPILLMIMISLMIKPMFKARALSFTYPFLAMALGYGLAWMAARLERRSPAVGKLLPALILIGLFLPGAIKLAAFTGHQDFRGAAASITRDWQPGDAAIVEATPQFWGLARYLVGPDWGDPGRVFDLHPQSQWRALSKRLGPDWTERLNLIPESDGIDYRGGRLYAGIGAMEDAITHPRLWYLHYEGREIPAALRQTVKLCALRVDAVTGFTLYLLATELPSKGCRPWPE